MAIIYTLSGLIVILLFLCYLVFRRDPGQHAVPVKARHRVQLVRGSMQLDADDPDFWSQAQEQQRRDVPPPGFRSVPFSAPLEALPAVA